ncbi:MAG: NAD(P)-dependent oxidoreductase [Hyphomicrobiaceae bacterium]|nr:NAD(P)-dependent oxidoreductase [Hyphomicrobiaceae bacterium]
MALKDLPLVVLTNRTFPETRAMLDRIARVVANDGNEPWPRDVLLEHCRHATGIMAFMPDRIDADFLERCPELQVVGAALKGFDNIDVEAASARGVWVTICSDLLTIPTAELAIGLMLALGRNMLAGDNEIRRSGFHGWRPRHYGIGLDGATVGIVGFGKVGQAIATRLSGFDCRILAYDSTLDRALPGFNAAVAAAPFDELLRVSDFVVLALPLLASTKHIIDCRAIAAMKPGALLVNPARGSLVDEAAVADAIARGHLRGYAADVFECEDWARDDRPAAIDERLLADRAATVLTPHLGSAVVDVRRAIEASAARSIAEVLQGHAPSNAINTLHRL